MFQDKSVVASKHQLSAIMHEDVVILNLDSGIYFGVNAVGARIWELIQEPVSVQVIQQTIATEYDIEAERCEQDIQTLLEKLANAGLIEVSAADHA